MTPEEFFAVIENLPPVQEPVYRLYHDDRGQVLFYSMEDLAGQWIAVDAVAFAQARHDVQVINGSVIDVPKKAMVTKLRPSDSGTCCDPRDICLVVTPDQPHVRWSLD